MPVTKYTCLTGMHRSGTSLMSSYFEQCGINMGETMVGAMRGNTRGHFEDTDFLQLHDNILKDNHCHMYSPKNHLSISDVRKKQANKIITKKQANFKNFGWKDPRTTLFLDLWSDTLPDCKFILLYREPFSVIDSLRRRGTDRRIKAFPWLPATAWIKYNQAIIDFHKKAPDDCIVVNIAGFNKSHEKARIAVGNFLDYDLSKPYTDVFHKNEIASKPSHRKNLIYRLLDSYYRKQLNALYEQLESIATISSKGL